jgi:hypothetical protein
MNRRASALAMIVCWGLVVSGCATISRGTSQSIQVGSTPDGAECVFSREGQTIGKVLTPGSIKVDRSSQTIDIVCTKNGHDDARAVLHSIKKPEPANLALLVFGLPGVAVGAIDDVSGANNHYQSSLMIALDPQSAVAVARSSAAFDGDYSGDVELMQTFLGILTPHLRHFEVHVAGGVGKGTVKHVSCLQPGDVNLAIDASGNVTGTANTMNTAGCTPDKAILGGRIDANGMKLVVTRSRWPGWTNDLTLTRK